MDLPLHEILLTKRFKMSALALLSLLLLSAVSGAETGTKYRLPTYAKPTEYILHIEPNLNPDKFSFVGTVTIKVEIVNKTSTLVLNQLNLTINTEDVTLKDKQTAIPVKKVDLDQDHEILTVELAKDLEVSKVYDLTIKFSGLLNNKNRGFYRSRYFDEKNNLKYIATTHFEPTGARLAFPCWDEPAYKASYTISITHLSNYTAVISNMPQDSAKPNDKTQTTTTTFKPTPPISSYLVAFVVSDYKFTENGIYRVFTKPNAVDHTKYALDFGIKVIAQLDAYTGVNYTQHMAKMDQISIKDFNAGAMENWGLVTYRETALLYEEGVTTTRSKQSIATIIAHEFAHQWFGNLVSPKWWEFIWLNEGFANYFQYFITNLIEPSWRLTDLYAIEVTQGNAFIADASTKSRPMNKAVEKPSEISALFDSIAYQKAGSVIRMMSHILTPEVFQKGLQSYLKAFELKVAESANLIQHLESAANKTWDGEKFSTIMNEWITKPGYPLVTVSKVDGKFKLSQERFLLYESDKQTKWSVPITYATEAKPDFANTEPTIWLKNNTLEISNVEGWILVNKQQTGYYRVNYAEENWNKLAEALNKNLSNIHPVNRAQLIDDVLIMARTNRTKYDTALSLTLYLKNETDYIPWTTTFRNLNFLQNMMYSSPQYGIFKTYIKFITTTLRNTTSYEIKPDDAHVVQLLKPSLMTWACKAEIHECNEYAKSAFDAWYKNNTKLNPDQKTNILCNGLKSANAETWNGTLTKLAESTKDKVERNTLLTVMGCSDSEEILKNFLLLSFKENSPISFEYAVQAIVANHASGVKLVLDILEANYDVIQTLEDYKSKLNTCIQTLGGAIVTSEDYVRLSVFHVRVGVQADVAQSTAENSMRNIEWVEKYRKSIDDWLIENEPMLSSSGIPIFSSLLLILSIFVTRFY